jgi:cyclopropane fatty-acyl-phospholipid synthase-like methyltransferase
MLAFPKSQQYDLAWVQKHALGGNPLLGMESLTNIVPLRPQMRVLDLACGIGITSVFLQREFGVQVWAIDNGADLNKMFSLFESEKVAQNAFPMAIDARDLPFPDSFFDAIFCVNAYTYFGTDDKYLPYIARFLKPDGYLAISDICLKDEIHTVSEIPTFLKSNFAQYWYHIHAPNWWQHKWEKTQLLDIQCAEILPESTILREAYLQFAQASQQVDAFAEAIAQDTQGIIQYMRLVGKRNRQDAFLETYQNNQVSKKM